MSARYDPHLFLNMKKADVLIFLDYLGVAVLPSYPTKADLQRSKHLSYRRVCVAGHINNSVPPIEKSRAITFRW